MMILPKVSYALAGVLLYVLPTAGLALESQFPDEITETSKTCGEGNELDCQQLLLSLLSNVRAETDGEQYDTEIGSMALAVVNVFSAISAPTPQVCAVLANAMQEIGRSAVDAAQAGQIFAIADSIRACSGLGEDFGRLLASPN